MGALFQTARGRLSRHLQGVGRGESNRDLPRETSTRGIRLGARYPRGQTRGRLFLVGVHTVYVLNMIIRSDLVSVRTVVNNFGCKYSATPGFSTDEVPKEFGELCTDKIGRASCRERV